MFIFLIHLTRCTETGPSGCIRFLPKRFRPGVVAAVADIATRRPLRFRGGTDDPLCQTPFAWFPSFPFQSARHEILFRQSVEANYRVSYRNKTRCFGEPEMSKITRYNRCSTRVLAVRVTSNFYALQTTQPRVQRYYVFERPTPMIHFVKLNLRDSPATTQRVLATLDNLRGSTQASVWFVTAMGKCGRNVVAPSRNGKKRR